MLLAELHGYKQYSDLTLREIIKKLVNESKFYARSGSFAVTLLPEGKNYVYRLWNRDDGYEHFLRFVAAHPSKHVVKVIRDRKLPVTFKRHESFGDFLHVTKLEKLTRLPSSGIEDLVFGALRRLIVGDSSSSSLSKLTVADLLERIGDMVGSDETAERAREYIKKHADFFKVVIEVAHHTAAGELEYDLHADNVMLRGHDPVITDPTADRANYLSVSQEVDLDGNWELWKAPIVEPVINKP